MMQVSASKCVGGVLLWLVVTSNINRDNIWYNNAYQHAHITSVYMEFPLKGLF